MRAAVAVAATYTLMPAGYANSCDAGYSKISDEPTCSAAAAFIGKAYLQSGTWPSYPSGCVLSTTGAWTDEVRLNLDPTGARPIPGDLPLCLTGAPPTRPVHRPVHREATCPWIPR